jgi:hypothetical protein
MDDSFFIDLISDLNLTDADTLDWEGKSTSLFCVVAGNVSDDLSVLRRTLEHLGNNYRGVFYIDGSLEHVNVYDYDLRITEIKEICDSVENVVYLHNHVIILNGVAFVGVNGWYGNRKHLSEIEEAEYIDLYKQDELAYLSNTIKQLQGHEEVRKIILVSNSMPSKYLAFNSPNINFPDDRNLALSLLFDYGVMVKSWLFGTNDITVDVEVGSRRFVNNPVVPGLLYWPKQIAV